MNNLIRRLRLMRAEKTIRIKDFMYIFMRSKRFLNPFGNKISGVFFKAMLALTYKCQCSCGYCGTAVYEKSRPELSCDMFKKIIDDVSRLPQVFVCVSFFGGEPLLREDIFELISYARKKGLFSEIDTNGLLLDPDNVRRLAKSGLNHVFVSLDSTNAEEHNRIKGKSLCFEAALEGITNCIRQGLSCSISTYASRINVRTGQIGKIIELGKKLGVKSVRILPPAASNRYARPEGEVLSPEEMDALAKFLEPGFSYLESTRHIAAAEHKKCAFLNKEFVYISPSGDIQPCPYIPLSFGNAATNPIEAAMDRMSQIQIFSSYKTGGGCIANDPEIINRFIGKGNMVSLPINMMDK